jgi:glycosyltransferase involved in cell wall biosynthesis
MKILQVIPAYAPSFSYGGTTRVCYEVSTRLANKGHDVNVWATDSLDANTRIDKEQDIVNGVKVKYFPNLSNTLAWKRIFLPKGLKKYARNHIKEFDVVHIHEFRNLHNIIVAKACQKHHIPYIVSGHGGVPRIVSRFFTKWLFDIFFSKSLICNASVCHALTKHEEKQYHDLFGIEKKRIKIIPNGIDLPKDTKKKPSFLRDKFNIDSNNKNILFLGRLNYKKGVDILLDAFYSLIKQKPNTNLILAGPNDGFLKEAKRMISQHKLEKNVFLAGPVYSDDKDQLFLNSDVFALSSRDEGLPMTVLEAASFGLPLVCSKECRIPEISKYDAGFETSLNPLEISKKLIFLLDNPKEAEIKGRNALRMVKEKFTWDKVIDEFQELYHSKNLK